MTAISLEGLALTLACALGWSLLDLCRKLLADSASAVATAFLLVCGQMPIFVVWSLLEWRDQAGSPWPVAAYWLPGLGSVALNLLAHLAFMQSVKMAPMSRTVPLLSLTPVFTTLVAIPVFAEWPTLVQSAGILVVVISSIVISRGADPGTEEAGVLESVARRGALLMAIVALLWSVTPALDKLAIAYVSPTVHALVLVVGSVLGLGVVAAWRREGPEIARLLHNPRALALVAVSAAIAAFAIATQLYAYDYVAVGLVETIKRGVGAAFALFAGWLLLSEHIGWRRLLAGLAMIAGVAAVML